MTVLKWTRITKTEYDRLTLAVSEQSEDAWKQAGIQGLRMKPQGPELRYYASRCQA